MANNRLDFIITNPGHYIELEEGYGAARIATVETQNGPPPIAAVGTAVFTLAARTHITSLRDLRGKRVAAAAAETFGFRQVWREMLQEGVDPFSDLAALSFQGFPVDKVIEAVRRGDVDAGIVRACVVEKMIAEGQAKAGEFRFVSAHDVPTWVAGFDASLSRLALRQAIAYLGNPGQAGGASIAVHATGREQAGLDGACRLSLGARALSGPEDRPVQKSSPPESGASAVGKPLLVGIDCARAGVVGYSRRARAVSGAQAY